MKVTAVLLETESAFFRLSRDESDSCAASTFISLNDYILKQSQPSFVSSRDESDSFAASTSISLNDYILKQSQPSFVSSRDESDSCAALRRLRILVLSCLVTAGCRPACFLSGLYQKSQMCRVGQNHTFIGIYGVNMILLAVKSQCIRSYTVCVYGSGQA
jgi:hypothetical protein